MIAAYDEEDVIARQGRRTRSRSTTRASGWRSSSPPTAPPTGPSPLPEQAGADLVLDLPRGGKIATQNAAVEQAGGELVAFSDANAFWEPDALRELVAPFGEDDVGYVCGQVRFLDAAGDNEEGAYWRYEMWVRSLESGQAGVTAGNGGIYAVRRDAYAPLGPSRSHDLNLPFGLAKRGFRSLYAPAAVAEEKLVPDDRGRVRAQAADDARPLGHRRQRPDVGPARLLADLRLRDPLPPDRPLRAPRSCTPLALAANLLLLRRARIYVLTLLAQLALIAGARSVPSRPGRSAGRCACSATTGSSPPRSRSARSTGSATARPPPGSKSEGTR